MYKENLNEEQRDVIKGLLSNARIKGSAIYNEVFLFA